MSALAELQRALERFDARRFAEKHGGRKESKSARSHEYLLNCPLCRGHNLRWNSSKRAWICWNCQTTGDTLYLIQLLERCSREAAIDIVFGDYVGGDARLELSQLAVLPQLAEPAARLRRLPPMPLPQGSVPAAQNGFVRQYLLRRGITDAMMADWRIAAGTAGRERDHALFPVFMDGALVYWQARAAWDPPAGLSKEERRAWVERTHYRKTLNPTAPCWSPAQPSPENPARCRNCHRLVIEHQAAPPAGQEPASGGEVLFNFDRARHSPHVVVCEGPADAIKVGPHAVALFGKGTEQKIQRLRQMPASRYTIYLDRGEEERAKAREIAAALSGYAQVFVAEPPEGHDAGSLTSEQNAAVVAAAVPLTATGLRSRLRV